MEITDCRIDGGKAFDWGKTSDTYAKYRDIYPALFYQKIVDRGLCINGQTVLDLGTGTGVLPRNMVRYGAHWTGTDISPEQIAWAEKLANAQGTSIAFHTVATEQIRFPAASFDVVTACQCFWYFDHEKIAPVLWDMLKPDGTLLLLYMAWLPYEDELAGASEALVLKYNPQWSGAGETRKPIAIPEAVYRYFDLTDHEEYDVMVPFTRESWHGRMKACRGVGASLHADELARWEAEHKELLKKTAPPSFEILHYAALAVLRKKKRV